MFSIPMHFRQFWDGFWGTIHQVSLSPPSKAGLHKAKDLNHPDTVTPLYLLSHSPELNPIEKLWQWWRKEVTHIAIFHKLEDTVDASEKNAAPYFGQTCSTLSLFILWHYKEEMILDYWLSHAYSVEIINQWRSDLFHANMSWPVLCWKSENERLMQQAKPALLPLQPLHKNVQASRHRLMQQQVLLRRLKRPW